MFRRHVIKDLSAYLDNQLSAKKRAKVEAHLVSCTACRDELLRLKALSEKLKIWHAPDAGVGFDSAVKNQIVALELQKGEVKMKKKSWYILVPSGVLGAILMLVFVGGTLNMYVKRGIVGRLRPAQENVGSFVDIGGQLNSLATRRYEPYYYQGDKKGMVLNGRSKIARQEIGGGVAEYAGTNFAYTRNDYMKKPLSEKLESWSAAQTAQSGEGTVIVVAPILPATGEGDKIIRTADISLEVASGDETYRKTSDICRELGGYLASSNFYKDAEGRESGTIVLRIPKDKFLTALDRIGALGKIENSTTNSQDVAQEYANLKARLDAAMVVYTKTLEALNKRQTTIPESMRLESELTPILQRVEELKNKIEYLNNAISFTTITLNFYEPRVSAKVLKDSKKYITESLLGSAINTVRFLAQIIPVAVVLIIIVAMVIGTAFFIKYWIIRLFKKE